MPPKRKSGATGSSSGTSPAPKRSRASSGSGSNRHKPQLSVQNRILVTFKARDEWRQTESAELVAKSSFSEFIQFILQTMAKKDWENYPAVKQYLEEYLGTPRLDLYTARTVKDELDKGTERRMFRIISASDDPSSTGDFRTRHLFLWLLDNCKSFSLYALFNNAFTHIPLAKHTEGKGDDGLFRTSCSTEFERILHLVLISEVQANLKKGTSGKKDKKTTEITEHFKSNDQESIDHDDALFPPISIDQFNRKSGNAQVIGFFVQYVTRAWNKLAQKMGYSNMEDVVLPYFRFDTDKFRFDVIRNRDEGYMPLESAKSFDTGHTTTPIASETFPGVVQLPDNIDRTIRSLIKHYLDDIRRYVFLSSMYKDDLDIMQLQKRMKPFTSVSDPLADRFKDFDIAEVESVAVARREALGLAPLTPAELEVEVTVKEHRQGVLDGARNSEADGNVATSIVEDLQDTIRNEKVPATVFKRKQRMVGLVRGKQFSTTLSAARGQVEEYLDKYCFMSSGNSDEIVELVNVQKWREVSGETQLVLIDPPYNVRRQRGRENSAHDFLNPDDMTLTVSMIDDLLRAGGHAIIFCSFEQFPEWVATVEEYHRRQESRSGYSNIGTGKTFNVDPTPMIFTDKVNAHRSFPGRTSCTLQNNGEIAVHLKKNGLSYEEEANMVNYKPFGYVDSSFSALKNTIDNVPGLAPGEAVKNTTSDPNSSKLLRPEQKSLALLKELISRFSQPGDLVVDNFAGTFSTGIACFSLPKFRYFAGVEKDEDCVALSKKHVVDRFAQFISDPNTVTNIDVPDDVLENACRISASSSKQELVIDTQWKAPPSFPQFQLLPPHIMTVFTSTIQSNDFFRQYNTSELSVWPLALQQRFNAVDTKTLLVAEMAHYNCYISNSLVRHPNAGQGLFAGKLFNPGDFICFYFGTLVYEDLYGRKSKKKLYGGSQIMGTTVERFNHYSIQVSTSGTTFNEIKPSRCGKRAIYVVPPVWCIGAYINDYKYDRKDLDYNKFNDKKERLSNERKKNVMFVQATNPVTNTQQLQSYHCISVQASRQINKGEELYADYGREDFGLT